MRYFGGEALRVDAQKAYPLGQVPKGEYQDFQGFGPTVYSSRSNFIASKMRQFVGERVDAICHSAPVNGV